MMQILADWLHALADPRAQLEVLNGLASLLSLVGALRVLKLASSDLWWVLFGPDRTTVERVILSIFFLKAAAVLVIAAPMALIAFIALITPNAPLTSTAATVFGAYLTIQMAVGMVSALDYYLRSFLNGLARRIQGATPAGGMPRPNP